jgi:predicted ribosome quality control (RQC) complex YloA/Tae2 family protein
LLDVPSEGYVKVKQYQLEQLSHYLSRFHKIHAIERVDDMVIKMVFDRHEPFFFDLRRGDAHVFMCEEFKRAKVYGAPFDVLLKKYFAKGALLHVEVPTNNRLMRLHVSTSSQYKASQYVLQLEFTGRNTNAIILDSEGVVQEALRHIDSSVSFRSVKVGEPLLPLPPREFCETKTPFVLPEALKEAYHSRTQARLAQAISLKKAQLEKKLERFRTHLAKLESEEVLEAKAQGLYHEASLVLANLHRIPSYATKVEVEDFDQTPITLTLPALARTPQEAANMLFSQAKKLRQKASSLHIERENLQEKIVFWERLHGVLDHAKSVEELTILLPKHTHAKKAQRENLSYESFYMEGYKIMVGKNEKGNALLLKEAKKNDVWLHVKELPSCHVIIRTDKQSVPPLVLSFAAKLCVEFSQTQKGTYLVDYTARQNVKVIQGASVQYVEYQTLSVTKE